MKTADLVIIGGGCAGLAAAVAAHQAGCTDILILERETMLGGILQQCIHNGFGLHLFKEELTGPEYAQRYIDKVLELDIPYMLDTMVLDISEEKMVTAISPTAGLMKIKAKAVVLATGCRERPRGALVLPGTRAAGIYTAGTAQKLLNQTGYMPGSRVVILGSGDIGLIMARRFTLQGAKVEAVVEIMSCAGGLARNVAQCLDDFDIPLLLNHTVIDIKGNKRVESVTIAQVDENRKPIGGTERSIVCDTLLLSVGLIPENELARKAGVDMSDVTRGAIVDETLATSVSGIFACGNALHVHDLADNVTIESEKAGRYAARYIEKAGQPQEVASVVDGDRVSGTVPQRIHTTQLAEPLLLSFRPTGTYRNVKICVDADDETILSSRKKVVAAGEMASITVKPELIPAGTCTVTVRLEGGER